jgi:hypothetical protein|eukprot:scaffold10626_cov108-Alexandrium_tamarense.AAC.1
MMVRINFTQLSESFFIVFGSLSHFLPLVETVNVLVETVPSPSESTIGNTVNYVFGMPSRNAPAREGRRIDPRWDLLGREETGRDEGEQHS